MNKSIIRILIIIIAVLIVSIFFILFGFKKVDNGKIKFYRKIKNENTYFNFIKPSPLTFLENEDLILYKNSRIFDKKFSENTNHYSRLIGKPGDLILIDNSKVLVNDKSLPENYDLYYKYRLSMSGSTNFNELLSPFNVEIIETIIGNRACDFIGTQEEADKISQIQDVINVRKITYIKGTYMFEIFPFNPEVSWNPDNFGPVVVPQKGTTITLNKRNIPIYKDIINAHENNELFFNGDQIIINGKSITQYTFKKDYYFVLNDNRLDYYDSRKLGFIPEDYLIGKAIN